MAETSNSSNKSGFGLPSITGAITGLISPIANLFGFQSEAEKKQLELKEQEQKYRQALSTLGNEQQYVLQMQLNAAKTETERLQLLENAITQIKIAQMQSASNAQNKTAILAVASAFALIAAIYVISKID